MGILNDRYKKLKNEEKEENKSGVLNQRAEGIYTSREASKYDEKERKKTEGDWDTSPFSSYAKYNAAIDKYDSLMKSFGEVSSKYNSTLSDFKKRFGYLTPDGSESEYKYMNPDDVKQTKLRYPQTVDTATRDAYRADAGDYAYKMSGYAKEVSDWNAKVGGYLYGKGADEIDALYGKGTAKALKEAAAGLTANAERLSRSAESDAEYAKYRSQFTDEEWELETLGWTAGQLDPTGVTARQTKAKQIEARIAEIDKRLGMGANLYDPTAEDYVSNDEITALGEEKEKLTAQLNQYKRFQEPLDLYVGVTSAPDFGDVVAKYKEGIANYNKSSAYKTAENGASGGRSFGSPDEVLEYRSTGGKPESLFGNMATSDTPGIRVLKNTVGQMEDGEKTGWDKLTDKELDVYYYLREQDQKTGGNSAQEYIKGLGNILGKRKLADVQADLGEMDTLSKVLMNVATTPYRTGAGVAAGLQNIHSWVSGKEINPYVGANLGSKMSQEAVGAAASGIDKEFGGSSFLGQTPGKLYQGLVSGGDSAVQALAMGHGMEVGMALSAMSSTSSELWEKGATNAQTIVEGVLSGIFEAAFEHLSLEMFFKNFMGAPITSVGELFKKAAIQMGVEGSEEVATELANFATDAAVMHSQSEWQEIFDKYKAQGMTDGQAIWNGLINDVTFGKLWDSFVGGAVGSIMLSGGGAAMNYNSAAKVGQQYAGKEQSLIDVASELEGGKYDEAVRKAAEKTAKSPSRVQTGFLAQAVEQNIDSMSDEEKAIATIKYASALAGEEYSLDSATVAQTGKSVEISKENPIAKIDGDKIWLNTSDGVVESTELDFNDDIARAVVNSMANMDVTEANAILRNYTGGDVATYIAGMKQGIFYGEYGTRENMTAFDALNKAQQKIAVALGQANRQANIAQSQTAKVGQFTPAKDETLSRSFKRRGAFGTYGRVYQKGQIGDVQNKKVNNKLINFVSDVTGYTIVKYDSRYVDDEDLKNANGKYVFKNDAIYVDMAAGNTSAKGLVAFALSHEITHSAGKWASKEYQQYAEWLAKTYDKNGMSLRELVDKYMNDYGYGEKEAIDEIVAESSEKLINDPDLFTTLESLREESPTVWEKVVKTIKGLFDKLVNAYKGLEPESFAYGITRDFFSKEDLIEQRNKWRNLLTAAAQNRTEAVKAGEQAAADIGINIDAESESANPDAFSRKTWVASDYVKDVEAAAKELAEALDVSIADARKYIKDVNSIAKIIAADKARLDFDAAEGLSVFISNVEYGGSIDFSTICKKRRLMTGTFAAIQDALGNTPISITEYLKIRNMMKAKGYEVSCGLCYVEGSRAQMGKFAAKFRELYQKYNPDAEWIPTQSDCVNPDKVEKMRTEHPDVYEEYEHFWNNHGKLREGDPNLFASQQKPKLFQADSEYNGEILDNFRGKDGKVDKEAVKAKNRNGGLRIQSFSDFEIIHLLDSMQVIMDMSRVGLAGQAYTKVADFARALGGTGLKINLSLIAKGVDENGSIILDEVEGMKRSEAEELRNKYSDNVGTILVVFNDAQLKAALNDPFIDFIIPFHRSQWARKYYDAMGLPGKVKDFTSKQNEKLLRKTYHEFRGRMVADKARNYMPNEYWKFDKSGKWNAEEYLRKCAKDGKKPKFDDLLVNNGDGSYSLQPDGSTDGYWKLLIDFKMYNNEGVGAEQKPVKPIFDTKASKKMLAEYEGGHDTYPVAQDIVDEYLEQRGDEGDIRYSRKSSEDYSTRGIVERALKTLDKASVEYRTLSEYKKTLDSLDAEKLALREARRTGDKTLIAQTRNRINILNERLAKMENSKSLQNVAAIRDVTKLNEDIRELQDKIKFEARVTGGTVAKQKSVEAAASELMKRYGIRRGKAELAELLSDFYTAMAKEVNRETLNREYMEDLARPIAEWLVDNRPETKIVNSEVQQVLNAVKGARVRVNDQQKGDIKSRYDGDFNKWRRSLMGYVTVTNDPSAMTLDQLWQNLSAAYPRIFEPGISDAHEGIALAEALAQLKADRYVSESEAQQYDEGEAYKYDISSASQAVMDAFWDIQPYETIADRYQKQIDELKARHRERLREERKGLRETIWEAKKESYQLAKDRARQQRERTELRRKIRNLTENMSARLVKPKANQYIPAELKNAVARVLSAVNTDMGRSEKITEHLIALKAQYKEIQESSKFGDVYDEEVEAFIDEAIKSADVPVREMNNDQLNDLYRALRAFDHAVRERAKMRDVKVRGTDLSVDEVRAAWMDEILNETKNTRGNLAEAIQQMVTNPWSYFETLAGFKKNSMSMKIYRLLNNAQLKMNGIRMAGNELLSEFLNDEKYMKSITDTDSLIDIGLKDENGDPITMTKDFAFAIYIGLLNEDYMLHMAPSGGTMPNMKDYYGNKGNAYTRHGTRYYGVIGDELTAVKEEIDEKVAELKQQREDARTAGNFGLVEEINKQIDAEWSKWDAVVDKGFREMGVIRQTIESQMSQRDKEYVARMQEFFDVFSKELMNETSMERLGFEIADVKDYLPIITDPNFRSDSVANQVKAMTDPSNKGFTKRRLQAKNPLMFAPLSDIAKNHLRNLSVYSAFAVPIYDMNRLLKGHTGGYKYSGSLREAITERFGKEGLDYLERLLVNVQGGSFGDIKNTRFDDLIEKGRGKFAQAALNGNIAVALVQTASMFTAVSELGWGPVLKAYSHFFGKSPSAKIAERSPLYWLRSTDEMSALIENVRSVNKRTRFQKLIHPMSSIIQFFDNRTVGMLWYAAENKVRSDIKRQRLNVKVGSEEYNQMVTETFNDVVEKTQPNYTAMQRSEMLRSNNPVIRILAMFKTQRHQNLNILYQATERYKKYSSDLKAGKNGVTKQDVSEARKTMADAWSSQIASAAFIALINFAIKGLLFRKPDKWKDEKTGELTLASVLKGLGEGTLDAFTGNSSLAGLTYNFVSSIVTGKQFYSNISFGYMETISDAIETAADTGRKIVENEWTYKKAMDQLEKVAGDVANVCGVPFRNVMNLLKGIAGHVVDVSKGEFMKYNLEPTKGQFSERMYEAAMSGNREKYDAAEYLMYQDADGKSDGEKLKAATDKYKDYVHDLYEDGKISAKDQAKALEWVGGETYTNALYEANRKGEMTDEETNKALKEAGLDEYETDKLKGTWKGKDVKAREDELYEEWKIGDLTVDEAARILKDEGYGELTKREKHVLEGRWENKKKTGNESFNEYDEAKETFADYATGNGSWSDVTKVIKQYKEWGYTEENLQDAVGNAVRDRYKKSHTSSMRDAIIKLLVQCGKDQEKAEKQVDGWLD